MIDYNIRRFHSEDARAVLDIFNYHIENTFAAYPERQLSQSFLDELRGIVINDCFYIVESQGGAAVGFALLRKHRPTETFDRAAELTYFIMPGHVRKGIGSSLLNILLKDAEGAGADTVLAQISSLNHASIAFHEKHGFVECGRLRRIGSKRNMDFDVVWMQKFLPPS